MKKIIKSAFALTTLFTLIACNHSNAFTVSKQLRSPEGVSRNYTYSDFRDENYLAFKKKLNVFSERISESFVGSEYEDGKNIAVSPLSIELCLGLAVRSADGNTRKEMLDAMGVDFATFNQYYKVLFEEYNFLYQSYVKEIEAQMILTNSIWIDDEITLKDSGLDALRDDYYCYSFEADFNRNQEKTCKDMQKFIKESTKGLINPELKFSPLTVFVLMNTLYLKDIWNQDGDELTLASEDYTFTNSDKTVSNKRLLQSYYQSGRVIQTMDYSSFYTVTEHGFRIQFIKPNEGKTVKDVMDKATMEYVSDYQNYVYKDDEKLERYYTNCIFPEFTADSDLSIVDMLKGFGIRELFDPDYCNFSNLTDKEVYCDEVRHITKLRVDKKGIEGAAVTYMAMCATSAPWEEEYKDIYETFVVDRDFGFILSKDNSVIFSGVVTNIDK